MHTKPPGHASPWPSRGSTSSASREASSGSHHASSGSSHAASRQRTGTEQAGTARTLAVVPPVASAAVGVAALAVVLADGGRADGAALVMLAVALGFVVISVVAWHGSRVLHRTAGDLAALRVRHRYLETLLNTVDVAVVAADDLGRLTLVNRQARLLAPGGTGQPSGPPAITGPDATWPHPGPAGRPDPALIRFYDTDGVTPLPSHRLPVPRTLAEGEVHDVEFMLAAPGQPARWMSAHGARLRADDGTSLGVVTVAYDVTRLHTELRSLRSIHTELVATNAELTSTNTELVTASFDLERSNEELAGFAGLVSHDLKGPLAAIAGYVELINELAEDRGLPADAVPLLRRIDGGVRRMRRLIDDLLAYTVARGAAPQAAPFDLQALATEVAAVHIDRVGTQPHQPEPRIRVSGLPSVVADPTMIRQLLDNLIGNAVKYVPHGAAAAVDITAESDRPGWVRIVVADRGIGIPPGQHRAILDSFHRAHRGGGYPGTGLGLAICQRIVYRHGGQIVAADNPGGGALIWFTLPVAETPRPDPAPNVSATIAAAAMLELSAANAALPRNRRTG